GNYLDITAAQLDRGITTPGLALLPPVLMLVSDTGSSASDRLTNNSTIKVGGLAAGVAWDYQVDGSGWVAGSGTSFTATSGVHSYIVRQNYVAGITSGASTAVLYTLDTSVATPSLVLARDAGSDPADGRTNTPTVNIFGLEGGASWAYRVDGSGNWLSGVGSTFIASSGIHTYQVQQTDMAGNTSLISPAVIYDIKILTPTSAILTLALASDTGDSSSDNNTKNPTINVTGLVSGIAWQYQVDNGAWEVGSNSSFVATAGAHSYAVNQVDAWGNTGPTVNATYTYNGSAPPPALSLLFDSGADANDRNTNVATVNVVGVAVNAHWQYRRDGGSWIDGSGTSFMLTEGSHSYAVRQQDLAGNSSDSSVDITFILDTMVTSPSLILVSDTGVMANDGITSNATINVTGLETGATWQYKIDNTAIWSSGSGNSFTASAGEHTYSVRQTDLAGNVSDASVARFTFLSGPPVSPTLTLASDTGIAATDNVTANPTIKVSGLMNGASWQYKVDTNTWVTGTGSSFTATSGSHAYRVQQTDLAGNVGDESAATTYVFYPSAITPSLSLANDAGSSSSDGITNNATINVLGLTSNASWSYQVDGSNWLAGSSSSFNALSGAHSYQVMQIDVAGNTSMVSNPITYTLNTTPSVTVPTLRLVTDTGVSASDNVTANASVTIVGLDAGATWVYQVDGLGSWTAGSANVFTAMAGLHTYEVHQVDIAGNTVAGSAVISLTLDTQAIVPSLKLATDSGQSSTDGLTTNPTINVLGLEANASWQYKVDTSAWVNGSGASFTASTGSHSYSVQQVDLAGNTSTASTNVSYNLDTSAPTVSTVVISGQDGGVAHPSKTALVAGDRIKVTLTVSEAVYENLALGTPSYAINVGSAIKTAVFDAADSAAAGANQLVFYYTIVAGDNDSDGITAPANALTTGSTVRDIAGNYLNAATTALTTANPLTVTTSGSNTAAPTVVSVGITSASGRSTNYLNIGSVVTVTLVMSEAATVMGTPKLKIDVGGGPIDAVYAAGGGTTQLQFTYTVGQGDGTTTGISIISSATGFNLNGGGIASTSGSRAATISYSAVPSDPNYLVATVAPGALTLVLASDTGFSASDNLTNNADINVLGLQNSATWVYRVDSASAWQTSSGTSFVASAGAHSYLVHQIDFAGNTSVASSVYTYTLDQTLPVALTLRLASDTGVSASDGITSNPTVRVTGLENVTGTSWQYQVDGGSWIAGVASSFMATTGSHSYQVRQIDAAGNVGPNSVATYSVYPAATIASLRLASDTGASASDNLTSNATVLLTGLDSGATWKYQLDGASTWVDGSGSSFTAMAGTHTYVVQQVDQAGNTSTSAAAIYNLDNIAPVALGLSLASDTGDSASDRITGNPTINISNLDSGASWQYQVDGGSWVTGNGSRFAATAGSHTYTVQQTDAAGNVSTTSSDTYTYLPPSFVIPTSPSVFSVAEQSELVGTLTANQSVIWTVNAGADASFFNISADGVLVFRRNADGALPSYERGHNSVGGSNSYTVNLNLTDQVGHATSQTIVVNVTDINEAPQVVGVVANQNLVRAQNVSINFSTYFTDPDTGNTNAEAVAGNWGVLTYSLTAYDTGSATPTTPVALPSGLTFNSATGVLSGTPTGVQGALSVSLKAIDGGNLVATQNFNLSVVAAPVVSSFTVSDSTLSNGAQLGKAGEALIFSVTMSERVRVTGAPQITFNINGQ
ncbi:MAG: Ig-like domain-containing protein, partial [Methylophilaceae bacterium]|nr:Ig-like domain-containing protein [Methylophilaceae bacterium]